MRNLRPSSLSRTLALVPPAVALIAQQSHAGYDVFLKIDSIPGEVTVKGHEAWIALDNASWGASRKISAPAGGGTREAAMPVISEVTFTKKIDKTSSKLFFEAVAGQPLAVPVIIELMSAVDAAAAPKVYYRLTLENVMVSSQSSGAATGDDRGTESISLNFTKIKVESFDSVKGALVHTASYDLVEGKASGE